MLCNRGRMHQSARPSRKPFIKVYTGVSECCIFPTSTECCLLGDYSTSVPLLGTLGRTGYKFIGNAPAGFIGLAH